MGNKNMRRIFLGLALSCFANAASPFENILQRLPNMRSSSLRFPDHLDFDNSKIRGDWLKMAALVNQLNELYPSKEPSLTKRGFTTPQELFQPFADSVLYH